MKKILCFFLLLNLMQHTANAQPIPERNTDGYSNGKIVLPGQAVITGQIRDNIRKKGEVVLLRDGKKTKFKANEIASVEFESVLYIGKEDVFYEVLWQGNQLSLLRKASHSSGIQFNGTEPILTGNDASIDDLLIMRSNDQSIYLLTKKNSKRNPGKIL